MRGFQYHRRRQIMPRNAVGKHIFQKGFFFFNLTVGVTNQHAIKALFAARSTSRTSEAKLGLTMDGTSRPIILARPFQLLGDAIGKVVSVCMLLDTRQRLFAHLVGTAIEHVDTGADGRQHAATSRNVCHTSLQRWARRGRERFSAPLYTGRQA